MSNINLNHKIKHLENNQTSYSKNLNEIKLIEKKYNLNEQKYAT